MAHHSKTFAFFDFDMTIVSRDSGYEFIKHRLNSSDIRKFMAYFLSPYCYYLLPPGPAQIYQPFYVYVDCHSRTQ